MSIIAEIGVDMKAFATASALVGWAGLRTRNDESAGKIKGRKTFMEINILVSCLRNVPGGIQNSEIQILLRYNSLKKE